MSYLPNREGSSMQLGRDCFISLTFCNHTHKAENHEYNIWQINEWMVFSLEVSKRETLPFCNSDTFYWENRIKWQLKWTDPTQFPCQSHPISGHNVWPEPGNSITFYRKHHIWFFSCKLEVSCQVVFFLLTNFQVD